MVHSNRLFFITLGALGLGGRPAGTSQPAPRGPAAFTEA